MYVCVNLVMSISNGATVVDRTYQDNNNLLNITVMLKIESRQQPITKIGTKEKELKYVLNLVLSGRISEKEVIEFACNDGNGNSDWGGGGSSSGDDLVG